MLTRFAAIHTMSLLDPTLSYKDFKKVDMVIEAVFEDVKIKHAVIKEVEQVRWKCPLFCYTADYQAASWFS